MRFTISLCVFVLMIASACNLSTEQAQPTAQALNTTEPTQIAQAQATNTPAPTSTPIPSSSSGSNSGSSSGSNNNSSSGGVSSCSKQTSWLTYTVVSGDTLFGIAQRGNTIVDTIAKANCLTDAGVISTGQVLYVPNPVQPKPANTGNSGSNNGNNSGNPQTDPNRYTLELFWIIQGDGGNAGFPVGCGDSLIFQQSGIPLNLSMDETIRRAFTYLADDSNIGSGRGDRGGWNPISETSLRVDSYSINNNAVTASLSGEMRLIGTCADAQLQAQIAMTIMLLTRTKTATIYVNGENLRTIFDESGMTNKTTYTWEEFQNGNSGNGNNSRKLIEYWVGSETNGVRGAVNVACDKYLAPIETDMLRTDDLQTNLNQALTALFDPNRRNPSTVYTNLLNTQNLFVKKIGINGTHVDVEIGGSMLGYGVCADPTLEGQIIRTIFQFEEFKTAKIMNNGTNLRQYVDMSGNSSLVDYVYSRPA